MKTMTRYASAISLASLLTGAALWAQSPAPPTTPPAPTEPRATGSINDRNDGVNRHAEGNTSPSTTPMNPGATGADSTASANAGAAQNGTVAPDRDTNARVFSPDPNRAAGAVSANTALEAQQTADAIRNQSLENRSQLASDISRRIDGDSESLTAAKRQVRNLDAHAQSDFKTAMKEVDAREKQLRKSIKAMRSATSDTWNEARANLASDYAAYNDAVARAQAIAGSTTSANNRATTTPSP